jgi:arylsulfatase A
MRHCRLFTCAVCLVLSVLGALFSPTLASEKRRPNFIIVLTDDLGYGDLASYGNSVIRTPELTRLARQGMRLTSFYSASPVCSPSRAALMTGRIPQREGFVDWLPNDSPSFLRRDAVTLAGLLKQVGYATALIGKWHLNGRWDGSQPLPDDHGFDQWLATGGYPMPSQRDPENFYRNGQAVGKIQGYSSTIIADEAIAWLRGHNQDRPFFLLVSFHAPHEEVASAEPYVRMYAAANEPNRALYYANITEMDYETGRLLRTLDEIGLSDDTLVLFTSDNGPEMLNRERAPWTARSYGSAGRLRGRNVVL